MVEAVSDGVVDDPQTLRRYAGRWGARRVAHGDGDDLFELVQIDAGAIEAASERIGSRRLFGLRLRPVPRRPARRDS